MRCRRHVSVVKIGAPEALRGCPGAMAPPDGLTIVGSWSGHWARHANDCDANASFNSTEERSPHVIPACSSAPRAASTGSMPTNYGSTALTACDTTRASGVTLILSSPF